MVEQKLSIGQRVWVKELNIGGTIYESAMSSSGLVRIYGVRLGEVVVPKNFVATEVWHCSLGELIISKLGEIVDE